MTSVRRVSRAWGGGVDESRPGARGSPSRPGFFCVRGAMAARAGERRHYASRANSLAHEASLTMSATWCIDWSDDTGFSDLSGETDGACAIVRATRRARPMASRCARGGRRRRVGIVNRVNCRGRRRLFGDRRSGDRGWMCVWRVLCAIVLASRRRRAGVASAAARRRFDGIKRHADVSKRRDGRRSTGVSCVWVYSVKYIERRLVTDAYHTCGFPNARRGCLL